MQKFIGPFWFLSFVFVFLLLLFAYASLQPEIVFYKQPESGKLLRTSKQNFFFAALALIMVSNILIYGFSRLIKGAYQAEKEFLDRLGAWFLFLAGFLNGFFSICLAFILLFNAQINFNPTFFGFLFYACAAFGIFWLYRLVKILLVRA